MRVYPYPIFFPVVLKRLFCLLLLMHVFFPGFAQDDRQLTLIRQLEAGDTIPLTVEWNAYQIPTRIRGALTQPTTLPPLRVAQQFLEANAALWQFKDISRELTLVSESTSAYGWTHVKYQQQYRGVPIDGKELIVHLNAARAVEVVNGEVVPAIALETTPSIGKTEAFQNAVSQLDLSDDQVINSTNAELIIYEFGDSLLLTYKVIVAALDPLAEFVCYVDAHTGKLIDHYNNLKSCLHRETYNANHGSRLPGTIERSENDGPTRDVVLDAAHENAGLVYLYYNNEFGRCSYDDEGATIRSTVHYGTNVNNAFWFPSLEQMVYGDGDGVRFDPLCFSLDVVAHELTHAVTGHESNLRYRNQSGALNESLSDIFGVLIDDDDWMIGDDVFTPGRDGDALRYLDHPPAGSQPDHMDDYADVSYDNGGVHINSGIPNKAAYLMIAGGTHHGVSVRGVGRQTVGRIFYEAQVNWLTETSDFEDAMHATLDAVLALGLGEQVYQTVFAAWKAVGVYSCDRYISVRSSHSGLNNTVARSTVDNQPNTYFESSHNNWQYIEIEYDCEIDFYGLRRMMTKDGTSQAGSRGRRGEMVDYSLDGRSWTRLTAHNSHGWERYTNYGNESHAWHSVSYGWSDWLSPNTPVKARFIRFRWDGAKDALHEIELLPCEESPLIRSSHTGAGSTTAQSIFDRQPYTFFKSTHQNWQYVELAFNCEVEFRGIRRLMTNNGFFTWGKRSFQGEGVSYSLDGQNWTKLTAHDANGWERYTNYGNQSHAWHSVNYGWSAWLNLNSPTKVRYIRFDWDGNNDALNEIELQLEASNTVSVK